MDNYYSELELSTQKQVMTNYLRLFTFNCIEGVLGHIPYRGKLWRGKTLVNLANDHKFAKV